jgi:hypothetical protein
VKCTLLLALAVVLPATAQAPVLQDGAAALRRARLDWTAGDPPQEPPGIPSLEVGWGGAEGGGSPTPLVDGEGLGTGTRGWGLGLQGRLVSGSWSASATVLGLREAGRTSGLLQRATLAYQAESGWRVALEQSPLAWGSGLLGGDLLGDSARAFPRLTLRTPELPFPVGHWHVEAFAGELTQGSELPAWIPDRKARLQAQASGLGLEKPNLWGILLRESFSPNLEASLGAVAMDGGRSASGTSAPAAAARTETMIELRLRLPDLARSLHARGASLLLSRLGTPEGSGLALSPGRDRVGLQLVWEGWDLGLEAAGLAPAGAFSAARPSYLTGFSNHGDPLGAAFGPAATQSLDLGLPLPLEGHGQVRLVHLEQSPTGRPNGEVWFLQVEGQWHTSTGRVGASLASSGSGGQGWSCAIFQAFRVF